jgi:sarcosine oxidase gamma subunit
MAADKFLILVFRSMARTAWHELAEVMQMLEARAKAGV